MNWIWWLVVFVAACIAGLYFMGLVDKQQAKSGVKIENIRAKLMLLSTDAKEIESFLMLKEPYITQELINLLIARIGELKISPPTLPNDQGNTSEKQ